jgi:hypothetical protein
MEPDQRLRELLLGAGDGEPVLFERLAALARLAPLLALADEPGQPPLELFETGRGVGFEPHLLPRRLIDASIFGRPAERGIGENHILSGRVESSPSMNLT